MSVFLVLQIPAAGDKMIMYHGWCFTNFVYRSLAIKTNLVLYSDYSLVMIKNSFKTGSFCFVAGKVLV